MTTKTTGHVHCAQCGQVNDLDLVLSSNQSEPGDLDSRPGRMVRDLLDLQIQHCRRCHYCAPDIGEIEQEDKVRAVMAGEDYTKLIDQKDLPHLDRSFLASRLIMVGLDQPVAAGWAAIGAAWCCDDNGLEAEAVNCRKLAVAHLFEARERELPFINEDVYENLLLADLTRRAGDFEQAALLVEVALDFEMEERVTAMFRLEDRLIKERDVRCYRADGVLRKREAESGVNNDGEYDVLDPDARRILKGRS